MSRAGADAHEGSKVFFGWKQCGISIASWCDDLSALISTDPSIWMSFIHLERSSLKVPCNETDQHRPKLHIGPVQFQSGLAKMLYRLNIAMLYRRVSHMYRCRQIGWRSLLGQFSFIPTTYSHCENELISIILYVRMWPVRHAHSRIWNFLFLTCTFRTMEVSFGLLWDVVMGICNCNDVDCSQ